MTRNARWRNWRPRYKAAAHVPDFYTLVPAPELSLPRDTMCRHNFERDYFLHARATALEREREGRNLVRERQLCIRDVGFVTWYSSSYSYNYFAQVVHSTPLRECHFHLNCNARNETFLFSVWSKTNFFKMWFAKRGKSQAWVINRGKVSRLGNYWTFFLKYHDIQDQEIGEGAGMLTDWWGGGG